ncbi:MAG TPA: TMEM165/GDT1 family protein [Caulobacteraceae bacterium]
MEPVLISAMVVALAEIGDRTQLLAIVLATRFRKPWPVIAGIFVATLANHGLAATAGFLISDFLHGRWLQYVVAASFFATAVWALIPDKEDEAQGESTHWGAFATTAIAFFLVEMGDKTQIATLSLAARFHDVFRVAAGTTIGMMLANVPAVFFGEAATRIAPLKYIRIAAAVIFMGLGAWTFWGAMHG